MPNLIFTRHRLEHTQHSNPQAPGANNCLDILKESGDSKCWLCFSFSHSCFIRAGYSQACSSLMKRVLNSMRNPKLAHILVLLRPPPPIPPLIFKMFFLSYVYLPLPPFPDTAVFRYRRFCKSLVRRYWGDDKNPLAFAQH